MPPTVRRDLPIAVHERTVRNGHKRPSKLRCADEVMITGNRKIGGAQISA
jgi:hypothetical protein